MFTDYLTITIPLVPARPGELIIWFQTRGGKKVRAYSSYGGCRVPRHSPQSTKADEAHVPFDGTEALEKTWSKPNNPGTKEPNNERPLYADYEA